jgi:hypothetical protein
MWVLVPFTACINRGYVTAVIFIWRPGKSWEFFPSPPRPDRLWSPPSFLSSGYQGHSLGVKRPGREADHSPPSSAEVKNAWSCTSIPPIHLHGVVLSLEKEQRDNFMMVFAKENFNEQISHCIFLTEKVKRIEVNAMF